MVKVVFNLNCKLETKIIDLSKLNFSLIYDTS